MITEHLENIDSIINTLLKKGKNTGDELVLLFYFFSEDEDKLEALQNKLTNLGFVEDDLYEDEGEFLLDIEYHTLFSKSSMVDIITTVSTLCTSLRVEFDGWEAEV
ncbi:ribonuclease E inhibitor RraB [Chitinophaga qingshengii]|uniref:Ribonuclease E inhibitor RraB n=1 Tax=Chitinophaga qingshengii TaxID=1569794 RepID=A0ABR7TQI9_9BACT|nr:ribonuclease E inhibitor RraB [Chitinophaga qingshengii]MBC9932732.1 ribonuclease E inhibitor RraB [Chitinophaga qingshengii]